MSGGYAKQVVEGLARLERGVARVAAAHESLVVVGVDEAGRGGRASNTHFDEVGGGLEASSEGHTRSRSLRGGSILSCHGQFCTVYPVNPHRMKQIIRAHFVALKNLTSLSRAVSRFAPNNCTVVFKISRWVTRPTAAPAAALIVHRRHGS